MDCRTTAFRGHHAKTKVCRHCLARLAARNRTGLCNLCRSATAPRESWERGKARLERLRQMTPLCLHCGQHPPKTFRGLCWSCSQRPEVRDLFPSSSRFAARRNDNPALDLQCYRPAPCVEPTSAPPGSAKKVEALAARLEAGVALFHSEDATFADGVCPVREDGDDDDRDGTE